MGNICISLKPIVSNPVEEETLDDWREDSKGYEDKTWNDPRLKQFTLMMMKALKVFYLHSGFSHIILAILHSSYLLLNIALYFLLYLFHILWRSASLILSRYQCFMLSVLIQTNCSFNIISVMWYANATTFPHSLNSVTLHL